MMKIRKTILFFILFFLFPNLKAEKQNLAYIKVDSLNTSYELRNNFYFFEDKNSSLEIDSIISSDFQSKFQISKKVKVYIDNPNSILWVRFNFINVSNKNKNLLLELKNPKIQKVDFYEFTNTSLINHIKKGTLYNLDKKHLKESRLFFEIHLKPGVNYSCIFKIQNGYSTRVSFLLKTHAQLIKEKLVNLFLSGLFYGVLFILFLFVFLSFLIIKDLKFLSFSIYIIATIFMLLNFDGFLFEYLWKSSYLWNKYSNIFFQSIVVISLAFFSKTILKTNLGIARGSRSFYTVLILVLVTFVISLYPPFFEFAIRIIDILLIITPILFISNYLKFFNRKNPHFLYYTIAFSLFSLLMVFSALHNFELVGSNYFTLNATKFAFFINIFLIFITSINKYLNINLLPFYNTIRQNIYEELQTQNDALQTQNEKLEAQKEELNAQKDIIIANNIELEKLQLAVSNTNNFIYIFNTDGDLLWYNASFSSMVEKLLPNIDDAKKVNICDISYNKDVEKELKKCISERKNVTYETVIEENGVEMWYQTTLNPIIDDDGNFKSIIAIDTDITKQKEYEKEINKQKQDLEKQKNIAVLRRKAIELQKKEITDSLKYAQRIQDAILPKTKKLFSIFEGFVILKPKDIVSGDFYWYQHIKGKHVVIGVDCTGHGVPGAFMSIVGTYLLNDIVVHNQVTDPAQILKLLNRKIKIALKVEDPTVYTNDGMDMSVCVIDKENDTLEYAGAMRPLFLFNGNKFVEVKGDKQSITSNLSYQRIQLFTNHTVNLNKGDVFYIFSDGIVDQFGGEDNKKFLSKRFQQVLKDIYFMDMKKQKQIIIDSFNDWKGNNDQVDDVFVLGIRY